MCKEKEKNGRVLCNVNPPGGGWRVRKPPPMSTGFPLDPHWMSSTGPRGSYPNLPQWPAYRRYTRPCLACPSSLSLAKKRLEEGSPAGSLSLWSGESGQRQISSVFLPPRQHRTAFQLFLGPKWVTCARSVGWHRWPPLPLTTLARKPYGSIDSLDDRR